MISRLTTKLLIAMAVGIGIVGILCVFSYFGVFYAFSGNKRMLDDRLVVACQSGNTARVNALLIEGADPMTRSTVPGAALGASVLGDHQKVVELLLSKGVNVDAADPNTDVTPLMVAVESGNQAMARYLIEKGANINARDVQNKSVMDIAIESGRQDMVKLLKQYGADSR